MKKIVSLTAAMIIACTSVISVSATELKAPDKTGSATISTVVSPTYVVSIPEDTAIEFNALSTDIGSVKATKLKLEPNAFVTVSAQAGELVNQADAEKKIVYTLNSGDEKFSSVIITDTETATALSVDISQEEWDNAYAGTYKATVTFTISYDRTE